MPFPYGRNLRLRSEVFAFFGCLCIYMDEVLCMIAKIGSVLWGTPTVLLFLFCGLFFSFKLRFLQFTGVRELLRTVCGKTQRQTKNGISPFQSMCTALAASIGTGNIVGVCAAITAGGPGAVLWMCLSALLGEATAYAENYLGVVFRDCDIEGTLRGGAMYTLKNGLTGIFSPKTAERAGMLYAVLCLLCAFGMGNAVQVNAAANALHGAFGVRFFVTGAVCAVCVGVLLYKGRTAVAKLTSVLVPLGCIAFFAMCAGVLVSQYRALPSVFGLILRSAFGFKSAAAGFSANMLRSSLSVGVRRGIFSNEAGLGTSVAAHAAADDATPHEQGLRSMAEVFLDTVVMCTLTAVCVLCVPGAMDCPPETMFVFALQSQFGAWAGKIVAVALTLFAFSTLLGWSFFGRESCHFVFGKRGDLPFTVLFCIAAFAGSCSSFSLVWELSDIINALLAFPNIMSLFLLSKEIQLPKKNKRKRLVVDKFKKRG